MYADQQVMSQSAAKGYIQGGGLAGAIQGGTIQRQPEVPTQLDALEKAVAMLYEEASMFMDRVQPVCTPSPVGTGKDSAGAPVGSQVGARIYSQRERIHEIAARLRGCRESLEV